MSSNGPRSPNDSYDPETHQWPDDPERVNDYFLREMANIDAQVAEYYNNPCNRRPDPFDNKMIPDGSNSPVRLPYAVTTPSPSPVNCPYSANTSIGSAGLPGNSFISQLNDSNSPCSRSPQGQYPINTSPYSSGQNSSGMGPSIGDASRSPQGLSGQISAPQYSPQLNNPRPYSPYDSAVAGLPNDYYRNQLEMSSSSRSNFPQGPPGQMSTPQSNSYNSPCPFSANNSAVSPLPGNSFIKNLNISDSSRSSSSSPQGPPGQMSTPQSNPYNSPRPLSANSSVVSPLPGDAYRDQLNNSDSSRSSSSSPQGPPGQMSTPQSNSYNSPCPFSANNSAVSPLPGNSFIKNLNISDSSRSSSSSPQGPPGQMSTPQSNPYNSPRPLSANSSVVSPLPGDAYRDQLNNSDSSRSSSSSPQGPPGQMSTPQSNSYNSPCPFSANSVVSPLPGDAYRDQLNNSDFLRSSSPQRPPGQMSTPQSNPYNSPRPLSANSSVVSPLPGDAYRDQLNNSDSSRSSSNSPQGPPGQMSTPQSNSYNSPRPLSANSNVVSGLPNDAYRDQLNNSNSPRSISSPQGLPFAMNTPIQNNPGQNTSVMNRTINSDGMDPLTEAVTKSPEFQNLVMKILSEELPIFIDKNLSFLVEPLTRNFIDSFLNDNLKSILKGLDHMKIFPGTEPCICSPSKRGEGDPQ